MNDSDIIEEKLEQAQFILLPSLSALGIITNILNIITLSSRALRSFSCTQYFLTLSLAQLLDSIMGPINELFFGVFQSSSALVTTVSCKLIQFFSIVFPFESFCLIVLASADRFCASSSSVRLRSLCKVSVAYRSIVVVSSITIIYMSGFLVIMDVSHLSDNLICIESDALSAQIYVIVVEFSITVDVPFLCFSSVY